MGNQEVLSILGNWPSTAAEQRTAPLLGKFEDRRLVIASGGRCLWDDIQKIRINTEEHDIMTINDIGMHLPYRVKHWYSNDHILLPNWASSRRPMFRTGPQYDDGQPIALHSCNEGVQHHWPVPGHGTSALNAIYVALLMGYTDVTLVGIPLDDSGHYFDAPWVKSNFTMEVPDRDYGLRYWATAAPLFQGMVKCVSGRLTDLLPVVTHK